jgi:hypothetical protein
MIRVNSLIIFGYYSLEKRSIVGNVSKKNATETIEQN